MKYHTKYYLNPVDFAYIKWYNGKAIPDWVEPSYNLMTARTLSKIFRINQKLKTKIFMIENK
jgi:histidinol-phosphate/aromatic aminotransferase/cobyric acid decarboxylase-like protein